MAADLACTRPHGRLSREITLTIPYPFRLGGNEMTTFAYKDLVIDFTSSFQLIWNDQGSGGEHDGAFWRPLTNTPRLQNFYPVGDLGWDNREDVNGTAVIAVVKDAEGNTGTALRQPLRYEQVWKDSGSGSYKDGSMWRPIPPDNYVALGLVCNSGYDPPSLDTIRCVRSDLVVAAYPGKLIWDDKGTNAWSNFGSWRINAPDAPRAGEIYLSPGTFIGAASHTAPTRDANAYALRLLIPEETPNTPEPPAPVLRSYSKPADKVGKDSVTYTTILPWFTVKDPNLSPIEQIMKSPEYHLQRVDRYKRFGFGHNNTTAPQTLQWAYEEGTDGSKSKEFSETTGIEFGVTWKAGAGEFSAKLSQSFTHSETDTKGWFKKETRTVSIEVPVGKAVAAYTLDSAYTLLRSDGSQVTTGVDYEGGGGVYWTQYPPAPAAKPSPPKKPAAKPAPAKKPAAKPLPAKTAVPAKSSKSPVK
jgi:Vacuolar protein sorting-associated protein 62/Insecticidal Crystal Toxin, P42